MKGSAAKKRSSKRKAIRDYCLQCSGDSPKEVTLCHIFDCPLWPYRIGHHVTTLDYGRRIEVAMKNHPEDFKALTDMGIDTSFFLLEAPKQGVFPANEGSLGAGQGGDLKKVKKPQKRGIEAQVEQI